MQEMHRQGPRQGLAGGCCGVCGVVWCGASSDWAGPVTAVVLSGPAAALNTLETNINLYYI